MTKRKRVDEMPGEQKVTLPSSQTFYLSIPEHKRSKKKKRNCLREEKIKDVAEGTKGKVLSHRGEKREIKHERIRGEKKEVPDRRTKGNTSDLRSASSVRT